MRTKVFKIAIAIFVIFYKNRSQSKSKKSSSTTMSLQLCNQVYEIVKHIPKSPVIDEKTSQEKIKKLAQKTKDVYLKLKELKWFDPDLLYLPNDLSTKKLSRLIFGAEHYLDNLDFIVNKLEDDILYKEYLEFIITEAKEVGEKHLYFKAYKALLSYKISSGGEEGWKAFNEKIKFVSEHSEYSGQDKLSEIADVYLEGADYLYNEGKFQYGLCYVILAYTTTAESNKDYILRTYPPRFLKELSCNRKGKIFVEKFKDCSSKNLNEINSMIEKFINEHKKS